ncbi:MAG: extracellular solute-binding protein [Spirochaetaceae bacterium]|nr:MAG: extracellular solute-binding protein [Spirochaetaceae bacterium]
MKGKTIATLLVMLMFCLSLWAGGQSGAGAAEGETAKKVTLHMMSHRYPALEYYAEALQKAAPPNVRVETELMPYDQYIEKMRINLAGGSDAYDITYLDPQALKEFAEKGWLMPIDQYLTKYDSEYDFSDIPDGIWELCSHDGATYSIGHHQLAYILFYRGDVLSDAGIKPPELLDEYVDAARKLTTPERFGTSLTLKPPDALGNEWHSYLMAVGGEWLDDNFRPVFNGPEGVMATEYIKELMAYAPPGVMNYANDESMVAMQQDKVAMMHQWSTRAAAMGNPEQSKVVGLVKWKRGVTLKPGGRPACRYTAVGYGIPAFTKNDPELIFQIIAKATNMESQRGGAVHAMPVRVSVTEIPELAKEHPEWAAAVDAIQNNAKELPLIAEFTTMREISTKRVAQALVGELGIQEALDMAAEEITEALTESGRIK